MFTSKQCEEKTADSTDPVSGRRRPAVLPARLVPIVAAPDSAAAQHRSLLSLDEDAALEEALDTVEAGSIQLQQKFDVRYVPGAIGKVDNARRGTLDRLLSQRMKRDKFEARFMRSEEQSESLLNRSSRLNVLLTQRPTKEKLEQINVIKTGGGAAHSNLIAAQASLASAQTRNRLSSLLTRRSNSLDLTKRNILQADAAASAFAASASATSTLVSSRSISLSPLLLQRPSRAELLQQNIMHKLDIPSPSGSHHADQLTPLLVGSLQPHQAVQVACGFAHTLVLDAAGAVLGFGNGTGGRLGRDDAAHSEAAEAQDEDMLRAVPRAVQGLEDASAVASGDNHSFAVVRGELWGWGSGQWGRLGNGLQSDVYFPVRLSIGRQETVRSVACGAYHTVVLTGSQQVFAFGWNKQGRVGVGKQPSLTVTAPLPLPALSPSALQSPVVGVAAGQQHTLAWTEAGAVYSWGAGAGGCLGHGDEDDVWQPRLVAGLQPSPAGRIVQCAVGGAFSAARSSSHALFTFGSNRAHELGRDGNALLPLPVTLPAPSVPIQALVCGRAHTLLLRDDGVWSWGQSSRGVLGRGETCDGSIIAKVEGVKGRLLGGAAGWAHSAVVTAAGQLYTWGSSVDGKLGY